MMTFNVKEGEVAKRLGISRDEARDLRAENLYQDEDFGKVGREVCWTEGAIEKVRKFIKKTAAAGVTLGDLAPMKVVGGGNNLDAPTVILDAVISKIYPNNPKYMEALLGGQLITVCVNSNVNFLPGMIIPSRQLAMRNQRVFDFIGRCPRGRGRW
ncbi:MAG: hypothetical protein WC530_10830 [Candidatus Omnitrophota bacterium]|jgi:hypothetical protein